MRTMRVMSRDAPWRRATRGTGAEARRRATVRAPPGRARETTKARAKSERPDVDALKALEGKNNRPVQPLNGRVVQDVGGAVGQ